MNFVLFKWRHTPRAMAGALIIAASIIGSDADAFYRFGSAPPAIARASEPVPIHQAFLTRAWGGRGARNHAIQWPTGRRSSIGTQR
jgi:hypothetical protein